MINAMKNPGRAVGLKAGQPSRLSGSARFQPPQAGRLPALLCRQDARVASGLASRFRRNRWKAPLSAFAIFLALTSSPAARPSADSHYSQLSATLDAAGGKASSARYSQSSSLGGTGGGISTVGSATVAKNGFIGQLYEVTRIKLTASPTTLDEGGTSQVQALATLDDTTWLRPSGGVLKWRVFLGPVESIGAYRGRSCPTPRLFLALAGGPLGNLQPYGFQIGRFRGADGKIRRLRRVMPPNDPPAPSSKGGRQPIEKRFRLELRCVG